MSENSWTRKRGLAIAVALVMVASVGLPVIAMGETVAESVAHAVSPVATSTNAAAPSAPAASGGIPTSPHPGTLDIDYDASGGAPTVDPSTCYYTVCYEPIMNVYQTLVAYNGSSTATFVPQVATCVPGTAQCTKDYGKVPTGTSDSLGFTGMFNSTGVITNGVNNGTPLYWTFVIDPRAHFYDAANTTGWPVYPTDVMYSILRTVGYSDLPYEGKTAGWILAQSLLPPGNGTFDLYAGAPDHVPFNNTPYWALSSMLVNNSTYCPSTAIGPLGHGCITFVADGSYTLWSNFLQFVADNLGGSIQSCAWDQKAGGAIPGFTGGNSHGDGSCTLPGGGNSTDASSFQSYLAGTIGAHDLPTGSQAKGTGSYSWDAWQNQTASYPMDVPGIATTSVGSGPYYSEVDLASSFGLRASPVYEQPSACGGNPTDYAQYTGYCQPAPNHFIGNVTVNWESSDGPGISGYESGTVDFADIEPNHISDLLSLEAAGKINVEQEPSIDVFQQSYVTNFSYGARSTDGFSGANNIPANFFSYEAARSLLQMSYPFADIETNVWTTDNVKTLIPVGSQLALGLGCYDPPTTINGCDNTYTVEFPYEFNNGVVDTDASTVGSAAWWWAQGTNPTSPYYDPELAACTASSPCQFSIEGATGAPAQDSANDLWASSIEAITSNAIKPNTPDVPADTLLVDCGISFPSACPVYNFGWIADYPDLTDYQGAYGTPGSSYGAPDDLGLLLSSHYDAAANVTACGSDSAFAGVASHLDAGPTLGTLIENLSWWANILNSTPMPQACEGPAYSIYDQSLVVEAPLVGGLTQANPRVLISDLGATIENALNFYTWTGQEYPIYTAAPWINLSSVNTNVMVGAGDDQFWYAITYVTSAPKTVPVDFKAAGVAKGGSYSVTIGTTMLTAIAPAEIVFSLPANTSETWTASSPSFYVASPHTGTLTTEAYPATTKTTPTVTLKYKNYGSTVTFKESGLPKVNTWDVIINGTLALPVVNATSTSVRLGNGTYTYAAEIPAGYTLAKGATGTFTVVAPKGVTVTLKYTPYNGYSAVFSETGLASGGWCVKLSLEKGTGVLAPKPSSVCSTTPGAVTFSTLANGTYTFTATAKTKGYDKVTGTITVDGANVTQSVTFTKT